MHVRIGRCDIDVDQRQISVDDRPASLSPRGWDVLEHLLNHRGKLVTTESLLALFWKGRTSDETYVRKTVSEIRRVLGDPAGAPTWIKTVPKHGYVFNADGDAPAGQAQTRAIAVLPFANFSDDPSIDHFCDGLTEEVLNKLSFSTDTPVIARTSSYRFKNQNLDIRTIGRALNASHILEGSVRTGTGEVRVTAQLIDASTGLHTWSETYECARDSELAAQDEVAEAISRRVRQSKGVDASVSHHFSFGKVSGPRRLQAAAARDCVRQRAKRALNCSGSAHGAPRCEAPRARSARHRSCPTGSLSTCS